MNETATDNLIGSDVENRLGAIDVPGSEIVEQFRAMALTAKRYGGSQCEVKLEFDREDDAHRGEFTPALIFRVNRATGAKVEEAIEHDDE